jgi:manganese/zinc/iron transport system substrate-binding protein
MHTRRFHARLHAVLIAAVLLAGGAGASAEDGTPRAVTTTGMVGDVAQRVAGNCVAVDTLMGPGVDPHLYEPRSSDVRKLRRADVILYSGYALEGQLGDVLERLGESRATLAVAPAAIATEDLITVQDVYGIDPHVWMDASLWARTAETVATALAEIVPECEADMTARARTYAGEIEALHEWIRASVASIPEERRVLVTAHDAFAYYGRAYGIRVEAVQGISTDSEAGIGDIREMVGIIVDHEVPAVFIESTINPRTIQAVIDAAADRGHEVSIGGELYADAMGAPDTAEGTYIGMMRANTRAIVHALGGESAQWPEALTEWASTWEAVDVAP